MKLSVLGIMLWVPLGYVAEQGAAERRESRKGITTATPFNLSAFTTELPIVEEALAKATGVSREDALAMYGRSSAASGRFDVAAAAYAMFVSEFGTDHPNSENVAVRLADCLFPFKYDEVNVVHAPSGPRLDPVWRMGFSPRPEHLRQAVPAFELAASLVQDQHAKGSALFKLGWVHRALGDWDASTAAWDRCANEAAPTKSASDALWLAAEDLEWTNRPAEAVERLKRLGRDYPDDARIPTATDRIENLQAEARRSSEWSSDSVASLIAEIESRASTRSPFKVYRSVVRWLQRQGEWEALIAVSRWASSQDDWPGKEQIASRYDLADALSATSDPNALTEAVERLREVVALAPDDVTAVHATIRGVRLLTRLERFDEADRILKGLADRVKGSTRFEPVVLTEYADWLVKRGNKDRAIYVLDSLAASHPDFDVSERLEAVRKADGKEGGR